jgi:hypothetical protein
VSEPNTRAFSSALHSGRPYRWPAENVNFRVAHHFEGIHHGGVTQHPQFAALARGQVELEDPGILAVTLEHHEGGAIHGA